jgi:hypothetical protein
MSQKNQHRIVDTFTGPKGQKMVKLSNGETMTKACYAEKYGKSNHHHYHPDTNPGRTRREGERISVQANLQLIDDTWERLLRSLERFEMVLDENPPPSAANRADFHRHKNDRPESVLDAESEVELQIMAFWHVVAPQRGDMDTTKLLLQDLLCWLGGREKTAKDKINAVDYCIIPTIKCILGEGNITDIQIMTEDVDISEYNPVSSGTMEAMAKAQIKTDQIVGEFAENPKKKASQHTHERGSLQDGVERLRKIAKNSKQSKWLKRFEKEYVASLSNNPV